MTTDGKSPQKVIWECDPGTTVVYWYKIIFDENGTVINNPTLNATENAETFNKLIIPIQLLSKD